jgi:AcrR family transcriptional regulator
MASTPRLPREARRAQLIDAAASVFRRHGYDKTSMDQVAQTAGVSRLIVYRNFGSKEDLYRHVLRRPLVDLGAAFEGLSFEQVAEIGAATVIMPVARVHADAFRLLWRDAWREPLFEDLALEFRTYVTVYARAILSTFITDEPLLDWAARSAGGHLVDGICNWLDDGDPTRDDELAQRMSAGLRALAGAWSAEPAIS